MEGAALGAKLGRIVKIDKRRKPATLPPCPLVVCDEVITAYAVEDLQELAVRGRGGCGASVATLAARDLPADPVTDHEAEPRSRGTGNEAPSDTRAGMWPCCCGAVAAATGALATSSVVKAKPISPSSPSSAGSRDFFDPLFKKKKLLSDARFETAVGG